MSTPLGPDASTRPDATPGAPEGLESGNADTSPGPVDSAGASVAAGVTITAPAFPREMILASAGSGKTFRITSRIIGLLAHGEPPESILASTFTRKAAGEILGRVLMRLAEAALDEGEAAELAGHAALAADAPVVLDSERCLTLLRDLVRRLHRLNIGTLDSFFIRSAQSFAYEIGLPPAWSIADTPTAHRTRSEALQDVFDEGDPGTTVELVRLAQRESVRRSIHRSILEQLEGLQKIRHQLDPAVVDPWSIDLGLEDEGAAPAEPTKADLNRLAEAVEALTVPLTKAGTPVKSWERALGNAAAAIRDGAWDDVLGLGLTQRILEGGSEFGRRVISDEVVALFGEAVEVARRSIGRKLQAQTRALGRLSEFFDAALNERLLRQGGYRFEDITQLLGGEAPLGERPDLHYRLDAGMRHLLLDEFQDTSLAQWSALRPIADALLGGAEAGTSGPAIGSRAAVIVADPKQSIYGWRGAEPELVRAVGRRYALDDDRLAKSWRSSQIVLDAVNAVFHEIPSNPVLSAERDQETATEWARAFSEHRAARKLPGYVSISVGPDDGTRSDHRPLLLAHTAHKVRELREEAPGYSIGILTRQNRGVARLIYELKQLGIEASEEGGNPLTDAPSVVSILALLRLADHPDDQIACYHVARTPIGPMIGYTDPADRGTARRLAHRIRARLLHGGYGRTISGWAERLESACEPRDARRLRQLVELAFRYEPDATLRPTDFVRWVETEKVEDASTADVRVMTVHQAKGLEFDIVVLPELDAQILKRGPQEFLPYRDEPAGRYTRVFPYVKSSHRTLFPEIEEAYQQHRAGVIRDALSGLYVAMTRARHALHIVIKPDGKSGAGTALTAARIVREALAPDEPALAMDDDFYSAGDAEWHGGGRGVVASPMRSSEDVAEREEAPDTAPAGRDRTPPAPLFRPSTRRVRMLPHRTPSGLGSDTRVELAQRLRLDTAPSLERGSIVHAWCEEIEWLDESRPDHGLPADDALRHMARRIAPQLAEGELDMLIAQFHEWIAQPAISAVLRRESYPDGARVELETPFVHRAGDAIIEGIIDRLVVWDDDDEDGTQAGAEVIDFKSDAVEPDDTVTLDQRTTIYTPQLEAYRGAVAGIFGLEEEAVSATLVFLRAGVVRSV